MKPLGLLGAKVNATKAWTELTQMLGEVGQELRMIVSDIRLENSVTRGPPTLHIQLSCQCEAERGTAASWHFNINGQPALLMMNMTWTVMSPGARGIKEWENKGLADYFRRISMGDCRHWLREFLEHWEKVPEPPVPPKKVPDADQSLPMPSIACIILGVIVISPVIIVICCSISRKLAQRSPKKPKEALYQEARLSSPALLSVCLAVLSFSLWQQTENMKKFRGAWVALLIGHSTLDFGSGHDLTVREFEPRVGLCADHSEPGACFRFCVSLSLCPSPVHALSLSVSKINKR
ncbi:retinoic acid early transcript 1E [Panthera onca]